jgi:hypothetical protein
MPQVKLLDIPKKTHNATMDDWKKVINILKYLKLYKRLQKSHIKVKMKY